jgi:hypothetical protein
MHCKICDAPLSDFEATRKHSHTYQYVDMCNACISGTGTTTIDRYDLADDNDMQSLDYCFFTI